MATKYPIILAHGIAMKDFAFIKAFGRIEKLLNDNGYTTVTSKTDSFGTIETNAEQLKKHIFELLEETGKEKVNIIAHSKGGLDTRYMLDFLDMKDKVASVTFLCTPHKGSVVATHIYKLPKWLKKPLSGTLNIIYKALGDEKPNSLEVCRQLAHEPKGVLETLKDYTAIHEDAEHYKNIFLQSYSTVLHSGKDDFLMGIPLKISRYYEDDHSDGLVSVTSAMFAEYKGHCIDGSISHSEIVDFGGKKSNKQRVYAFYKALCEDLAIRGY